ncbi:hypothetical protein MUK42_05779 [Musa troglodytarum]|uniref:Uncharacterized protein n=1 Tax=Musa troglodytarum TaxID=320322 RepID=A0A9E7JFB8_9LILI|nr:hypothetical protein MUK42_05779 [Musa troglodytarum]
MAAQRTHGLLHRITESWRDKGKELENEEFTSLSQMASKLSVLIVGLLVLSLVILATSTVQI